MRGNLRQSSLADVLRHLYAERKSGVLYLAREGIQRRVHFRKGVAIFAEAADSPPVSRDQAETLFYALFNWISGEFSFEDLEPNVDESRAFTASPPTMILEGSRRIAERRILEDLIGGSGSVFACAQTSVLPLFTMKLSPSESAILKFARERERFTARDLPHPPGTLDVVRALNALVSVGLLEVVKKVPAPEASPPIPSPPDRGEIENVLDKFPPNRSGAPAPPRVKNEARPEPWARVPIPAAAPPPRVKKEAPPEPWAPVPIPAAAPPPRVKNEARPEPRTPAPIPAAPPPRAKNEAQPEPHAPAPIPVAAPPPRVKNEAQPEPHAPAPIPVAAPPPRVKNEAQPERRAPVPIPVAAPPPRVENEAQPERRAPVPIPVAAPPPRVEIEARPEPPAPAPIPVAAPPPRVKIEARPEPRAPVPVPAAAPPRGIPAGRRWWILGAAVASATIAVLLGLLLLSRRGAPTRSDSVAVTDSPAIEPEPIAAPAPENPASTLVTPSEPTDAELFYSANLAFESGEYERSKTELETLLERQPGLAAARELMTRVERELAPKPRAVVEPRASAKAAETPPEPKPVPVPAPAAQRGPAELFEAAQSALARSDLETAQAQLDALEAVNASYPGARKLQDELALRFWERTLPLAFNVRHDHALGNCNGVLQLTAGGFSYRSKEHEWVWSFAEVTETERRTPGRLRIETTSHTSYNFELNERPAEKDWERHQELWRR